MSKVANIFLTKDKIIIGCLMEAEGGILLLSTNKYVLENRFGPLIKGQRITEVLPGRLQYDCDVKWDRVMDYFNVKLLYLEEV